MHRKFNIIIITVSIFLIIMPYFIIPEESYNLQIKGDSEKVVGEEAIFIGEPVTMSEEDILLLALVTMAEAENQSEYGQRLVIDTILNRVDMIHFPDTIHSVIYQKNQFTSMWNGRFDRCFIQEDIKQLVMEEVISRTNNEVVFFRTGRYSSYGVPLIKVGDHYFSTY